MCKRIVLGTLGILFAASAAQADWFDYENRWERRYRQRTLSPSGYVRGHLVDPAGQGLPGLVALTTPNGAIVLQAYAASIQGGRFDLGRVAPGRYLLRVTSLGPVTAELQRPAPVEVVVEKGRTSRPLITAQPGTPIDLNR